MYRIPGDQRDRNPYIVMLNHPTYTMDRVGLQGEHAPRLTTKILDQGMGNRWQE